MTALLDGTLAIVVNKTVVGYGPAVILKHLPRSGELRADRRDRLQFAHKLEAVEPLL